MAQLQQSYMKDATAFHQFHRKTQVGKGTILVSINVSSLYKKKTSRRRNEVYEKFNNHNAPIPTHHLREMLRLIFQENLFRFNEEKFSQTKMGEKNANISMAKIETKLIQQSETRLREWKRYIDDSLLD